MVTTAAKRHHDHTRFYRRKPLILGSQLQRVIIMVGSTAAGCCGTGTLDESLSISHESGRAI